jgi:hypothetical protein
MEIHLILSKHHGNKKSIMEIKKASWKLKKRHGNATKNFEV